ncbi:MAG: dUTP diphosphatase [Pseudomonadota bacterium]
MTVAVPFLWTNDADPTLPGPVYATGGAAGADVRANLPADARIPGLTLGPGRRLLVPTGLKLEIPSGYEIQVRARSGLALKHGITLANAVGTIDSDYRGPLGIILLNTGHEDFQINHGDRIAQLVVAPVIRADFVDAPALGETTRAAGGFGSTGRD